MTEPAGPLFEAIADRYRIERELGAGGMATVYLAQDLKHDRKVAVKVLRPDLAASLGAERFHREIRIAAALQHPHILPLYDSGDAGGFLFYVMPFVDGMSLREKLLREVELPVSDAVRILRDVADALAAAHQHGVVHRDLKPENVMLSGRHALVTDFGVAKAVSESTGRQSLTTLGVALGTPTYMAPEQATADPHLDHRADIYAFGVLAYELLAGRPPFSGLSPQEILAAHVTTAAEPVTKYRATIPPTLSALVMRCLEKRPADRWQSAEELIPQLEAVLTPSGGMTPARPQPVSANGGSSRAAGGGAWKVRGAAIALLVVVAVAGTYWWSHRNTVAVNDRAVAVLPFEDISGDTGQRAFILGMHGEIVTQLSKIPTLQVASRSSSSAYLGSTLGTREIAKELGVDKVLTGTVQRAGGQIHFQVALEDAVHGRPFWADSYDKQLTAENLFAIQGEVARQVANALSVKLSDAAVAELSRPPTTNLAALDLYHQAELLWLARGSVANDTMSVRLLQHAVALDSSYAQAWSLLAQAQSWSLRSGLTYDTLPAWRSVERTRAFGAGSLESHLASAYYRYYGKADYASALADLQDADKLLPNNSDIANAIGLLLRRLGRWDEARAAFMRATALDRRSVEAWTNLGDTELESGSVSDAIAAYDEALATSPGYPIANTGKLNALLYGMGDTVAALDFARRARPRLPRDVAAVFDLFTAELHRAWAAQVTAAKAGGHQFDISDAQQGVLVQIALASRLAGDRATTRGYADSAVSVGDSLARLAKRRPGDPFGHEAIANMLSAIALAAAGDSTRAIPMAERAATDFTVEKDAADAYEMPRYLAIAYMFAGRRQQAIASIRKAMAPPRSILPGELRLNSLWDPLRSDPAFQALASGRTP